MLNCKDVTRLISESMDHPLPVRQRVGMRLHLLLCDFCARYRRQLRLLRDAARRLAALEEGPPDRPGFALSPEARERMRKALESP
jgi:hypothetical protein